MGKKQKAESAAPSSTAKKQKKAASPSPATTEDKAYYLVKSEPTEFSIDMLESKPDQTEPWTGVRNAQARNIMKGMRVGDQAFFYHSSCKVPGIVGLAKVVKEAYPDHTSWDPSDPHHDPKSSPENPKWFMVDWQLVRKTKRQITLEELKGHKEGALAGMVLLNRSRLSVQPVTAEQWEFILGLEEQEPDSAAADTAQGSS